jgi:hypothetical protein
MNVPSKVAQAMMLLAWEAPHLNHAQDPDNLVWGLSFVFTAHMGYGTANQDSVASFHILCI